MGDPDYDINPNDPDYDRKVTAFLGESQTEGRKIRKRTMDGKHQRVLDGKLSPRLSTLAVRILHKGSDRREFYWQTHNYQGARRVGKPLVLLACRGQVIVQASFTAN